MGTSVSRSASEDQFYKRGESFRVPGIQVDGMDVLAVRDAAARAVARARAGEGPYILEVKTYRYRGHSMSDPAKYRTKEEVDEVKKTRDPIDHLKMLLAAAKATEEELKAIDNEVKAIVAEAVQFAQESPEPDPSELYTDVYVEA
jgi:pyruvate dehydrogenase E1 component alpha subunit